MTFLILLIFVKFPVLISKRGILNTFMAIVALGINHKTASVDLREKVAFSDAQLSLALDELTRHPGLDCKEAVIVSTCNRTELYCHLGHQDTTALTTWLSEFHDVDAEALNAITYQHHDDHAIVHLMKVAAGLDSLVLGEPQILGQVKQAFMSAKHQGAVGGLFERLFQKTFAVAKQVRSETDIGASAVSVAYAAVNLAKHIYGDLSKTSVLLIGAGETIELVARHINQHQPKSMTVANRTKERAMNLALEFDANVVTLGQIPQQLEHADIVISSTASTLPIIGKGSVEQALKARRYKPMLLIDIAVPRDIEAQVGDLDDAYLYTVDDLQAIVAQNLASREQAAEQALGIIEDKTAEFVLWQNAMQSVDVIKEYREQVAQVKGELLAKALTQLEAGKSPELVVTELANKLSNRLMHAPTRALKEAAQDGDAPAIAELKSVLGIDQ